MSSFTGSPGGGGSSCSSSSSSSSSVRVKKHRTNAVASGPGPALLPTSPSPMDGENTNHENDVLFEVEKALILEVRSVPLLFLCLLCVLKKRKPKKYSASSAEAERIALQRWLAPGLAIFAASLLRAFLKRIIAANSRRASDSTATAFNSVFLQLSLDCHVCNHDCDGPNRVSCVVLGFAFCICLFSSSELVVVDLNLDQLFCSDGGFRGGPGRGYRAPTRAFVVIRQ